MRSDEDEALRKQIKLLADWNSLNAPSYYTLEFIKEVRANVETICKVYEILNK